MDDPKEARALIDEIRKEMQVDHMGGESVLAKVANNSLRVLSAELYSKPTHFILELIQNADDNHYEHGVEPKLTVLYESDGRLWIGCNEVGFSASNVWAICRVGESTKKMQDTKKGYTGEKGIGFKSVFRVAEKVWIKSRELEFMFDRSKPLGMIAPEWAAPPQPELVHETTVICLQIPTQSDRTTVVHSLKNLKPELLIFLRQLKHIDVESWNSTSRPDFGYTISKEDDEASGVKLTKLKHIAKVPTSTVCTDMLLVFEQTVSSMPSEEKRPGVTQSNIVMAFPVNDKVEAKASGSQTTFAFLPVRSYGFPFLLQADFIVNAARDEIQESCAWNKTLVFAALNLFESAVDTFNTTSLLKYTWPRYLQSQGTSAGTIFHDFFRKLQSRMKGRKVIESRAGTLEAAATMMPQSPRELVLQVIPPVFLDNSGKPLITRPGGAKTYASSLYNPADLAVLGIQEMTMPGFSKLLEDYATREFVNFRSRPEEWHASVAEIIVKVGAQHFRHINLIPLRNGSWISGNNKPFFFPDAGADFAVPRGIDIKMIATGGNGAWLRRQLYSALGAKTIDTSKVHQMIVDQHTAQGQHSSRWTVEDVVEHAWFLFTAISKPSYCNISGLLVAPESGPIRIGAHLYMDGLGLTTRVSDLLHGCPSAKFISTHYMGKGRKASPDQLVAWLKWLQSELHVNVLPRLLDRKRTSISPEFRWLVESGESKTWLTLLRDHWDHYKNDIPIVSGTMGFLSNSLVRCKNGVSRTLKEVYLPAAIKDEPLAAGVAAILDVDDPNDFKWTKLTALSLSMTPTTRLYLDILKKLASTSPLKCNVDDVKRLYTALSHKWSGDGYLIKNTFEAFDLVFIPHSEQPKWVSLRSARWTAPSCLSDVAALKALYLELRSLFTGTLGVRDATLSDVVDRLEACSGRADQVGEIKSLLMYLSRSLAPGKPPVAQEVISRLLNSATRVLPVRLTVDRVELRSTSDQSWFYADTTTLRTAFAGKVALLDFDMINSVSVTDLIKKLGLEGRRLKAHACEDTVTAGEQIPQPGLTDSLQWRAKYITYLVPRQSRDSTLARLTSLTVYSATTLTLKRWVEVNGRVVDGRDGHGNIQRTEKDGQLIVYVSKALVDKGSVPSKLLAQWLAETFGIPSDKQACLKDLLDAIDDTDAKDILEDAKVMANAVPPKPEDVEELIDGEEFADDEPAPLLAGEGADVTPTDTTQPQRPALSTVAKPTSQSAREARRNDSGTTRALRPMGALNGRTNGVAQNKALTKTNSGGGQGGKVAFARADLAVDGVDLHNVFDMREVLSALPRKPSPDNAIPSSTGRSSAGNGHILSFDEGDPRQLEIGSQGEHYVYKLLAEKCGASADCWTSSLRSQHGLPEYEAFEGDMTDFTITDRTMCDRFTEWLRDAGRKYLGKDVTYRIEVKTTAGPWHESFFMSASQYDQAVTCHISDTDVYVILRVFDVAGNPNVSAYVDPHGLELEKKLSFTTAKYDVRPN